MNISASVMNSIPFSGSLTMFAVAFIASGSFIIAGYVFKDSMRQRRANHLQAAEAHPELEAFGIPMTRVKTQTNKNIDTGAILRREGFQV
jgi:hypothetical protein